jgi:hypothetical protein
LDRLRKGIDLRVVIGAVLIATSGCVSSGGAGDPFTGPAKSQIVIEISNQGFNQATVWMLSGSGERRLGTVNGKGEKSFTIRWPRSDDLRLRVRVVGKRGFTTARKLVFPGENVELRIT